MIEDSLKLVFEKNRDKSLLFLRNLLKEQLQYFVLNYIYNSVYADQFLFKGGTVLRFCFDLPRLSEDLDFDVKDYKNFDFDKFTSEIKKYFIYRLQYKDIEIKISGRNKIIYLKFPILKKIGFPIRSERPTENDLFLRIDLAPIKGENFKEDISLKSSFDFSFIIKRYSIEDIFVGKIAAILSREAFEGKLKKPRFKGRDYFDVFWLSEKGIKPNLDYLTTIVPIKKKQELKKALEKKFKEALKKKEILKEDLLPFFSESKFVEDFMVNLELFSERFLKKWS